MNTHGARKKPKQQNVVHCLYSIATMSLADLTNQLVDHCIASLFHFHLILSFISMLHFQVIANNSR